MNLLPIALGIAALVGIGLPLFHFIIARRKRQRQVRVILFHHIGNDKVYKGITVANEKNDAKLGLHIVLNKGKVGISDIDPSDYYSDLNYSKCLQVCKYGEDDYRVMTRRSKGCYILIEEPEYEEIPNPEYDPNDFESPKTIHVVKLDEDNNPVSKPSFEPYEESIGVDQDSRTAIRFNRQFNARMDELMKDKKKMIERLLPIIGIAFVGLVLLIGFVYMTRVQGETMTEISDDFKKSADDYNSDNFFARITDWADSRVTGGSDAPPK